MSIGANTLDFVRSLFRRYDYERPPINPSNYQGVNSPYFQYGMQTGTMGGIRDQLRLDTDLVSRFVDYEDMDDSPLISAAHDIYAEDATQLDSQESHSLWFKCSDGEIKKDFEDLFYKRLKTEENIWRDVRTLCKYGNGYSEIVAKDRAGVIAENFLAPPTMRRIEVPKEYGNLGYRHDLEQDTLGFIYDDTGTFSMSTHAFFDQLEARIGGRYDQFSPHDPSRNGAVFEGWEVVHTRLLGKNPSSIYGFGVGESARWIFKRLMLLEDSIIMHRITRAPSRFAYYIDVSNIPPQETASYLNRVKQSLKKQKFINPNTGRLDTKFNVACLTLGTRIPLLNGETKTLSQMISDHESGKQNWVYSYDIESKRIVAGKVSWAGVTRKNAELVSVKINTGACEIVTPDHKFLTKDAGYVCAKDLKPGQSIVPLYRNYSDGREHVKHQIESGRKWEQTHRAVYRSVFGEIPEKFQIHHKDNNKTNNTPDNLEALSLSDHLKLHLKDQNHPLNLIRQNPEWKKLVAETNRKFGKMRNIVAYNNSPKHAEDNAIRSASLKRLFKERKQYMRERMKFVIPDGIMEIVTNEISSNPGITITEISKKIMESDWYVRYLDANPRKSNNYRNFCRHQLLRILRANGVSSWLDMKERSLSNHKVVSVNPVDYREDTGCITVDKYHNFGLESGVIVKNSSDEDFFIPSRDGKDSTRIEPINGPIYDAIEDVKFFESKLFAALKVPRPYLTYEEATGKTHLSAEDARFARTILRVQREYLNGRKKVARVHLAARGINPDAVDFSIHMTIPSAIFELAQLEIRNAELELAEKFGAFAPRYWIMTKILGFSDDEIVEMERMRQREENAGELPPEASAAGSISQAASKATGTKGRSPVESTDAHLFRSVKKNTESLLEKIDELRNNDKRFNGRWSEMNSFFRDLRESMNVRRR